MDKSKRSKLPVLSQSDIWVVIPGYNEEKYLSRVLKKVKKYTPNIIFVDDGSQDATASIAEREIKHVLVHKVNLGKGSALKTGVEFAFNHLNAQAIIMMDADDQHDSQDLSAFFEQLKKGEQVVLGIRKMDQQMPIVRRLGSQSLSFFVWLLFGVYVKDILSGYKGFTKKIYQKLCWDSRAYGVESELAIRIAKYKLPFAIVPINTIYHDFDRGMTMLDSMEIIIHILTWRIFL